MFCFRMILLVLLYCLSNLRLLFFFRRILVLIGVCGMVVCVFFLLRRLRRRRLFLVLLFCRIRVLGLVVRLRLLVPIASLVRAG